MSDKPKRQKKVPAQKNIKKKRKTRGGKKKKDPDAPKRPKTAYLCYAVAVRSQVQKDNPEMKFVDITRKISEQWKALTADERKPYDDMAAKDKERYEKAKKAYEEKEKSEGEDEEGGSEEEDEDEDSD